MPTRRVRISTDPEVSELDRLIAAGRHRQAVELLESRLEEKPESLVLRQRLADVLAVAGETERSVEVLYQLAEELAGDGFVAKAIAVLKKIERNAPGQDHVQLRLAELMKERQGELHTPAAGQRPPSRTTPRPAPPPAGHESVPHAVWLAPLLMDLSAEDLVALIQGLELQEYQPGEIVVTEGEPGSSLYIVASGSVRVYVRNRVGGNTEVRRIERTEFFGEISLLTDRPRTATIVAATPTELLEIGREAVLNVGEEHPRVRDMIRELCLARLESSEERDAREELDLRI